MSTTRQAGRPDRKSAQEVDKEIRKYFESDIGIMACHYQTGYSTKTISTRYESWDKLLKDRDDIKFLDQQDKAKARALLALDNQIIEVSKLQELLKESANVTLRARVSIILFDMIDRKASLEFTPTVATRVKQEVNELIEKFQKRPITERELQAGK